MATMFTWRIFSAGFLLQGLLPVTLVSSSTDIFLPLSTLPSSSPTTTQPSLSASLMPSSSSSSFSSTTGLTWQHKAALDNMVSSPSHSFLHRYLTVPTRGKCALECHRHTWCNSFFYLNSDTATCLLESVALQSMDVGPGWGFTYFLVASQWCHEKEGFIFYPGQRFCFRVFTEVVMDWHFAHERCHSQDLQLVVPANSQQMTLLLATVNRTKAFRKKNAYLGIIRPLDEWDQPWQGSQPTFVDIHNSSVGEWVLHEKFWAQNNPNNQNNNQNCLQIDRKRGSKLNDLRCKSNNYFVCQKIWQ